MLKQTLLLSALLMAGTLFFAFQGNETADDGYEPGDVARSFELKNIDGKMWSPGDMPDAKGFIIVFTCNHCPFAKKYEDKLVKIDKTYRPKGYPIVAINPNDPDKYEADSYENMIVRAREKGFTFPYLVDQTQEIAMAYGAKKTPHVYVVEREGDKLVVRYVGGIDDNANNPARSKKQYLTDAVDALLAGNEVDPSTTKAIGCSIKWAKK